MRALYGSLLCVMSLWLVGSTPAQEKPKPDARFGNWLYKAPDAKTWKKSEKDGAVIFSVDLPPGDFCTLTLFAGGKAEADFQKQFAAVVDADQKAKGTVKIEADGGPQATKSKEGFDVLTRNMRSETAALHTLHMYLGGHSGDRFDLAAFQTSGEETWKMYGAQASEFLLSLKLANSLDPAEVEKLVGKTPADAPPVAKTAPAVPGDAADTKVEVLWSGSWWKATVVKTDGEKRYIRYDGYSDHFNEWVGPDRIRALGAGAKVAAAAEAKQLAEKQAENAVTADEAAKLPVARGDGQFSGLYVQVQSWFFNGSMSLEYVHYYFFADGHVYRAKPPGGTVVEKPGATEFAALLKADSKNCGTYVVRGDKITFQFPGEKPNVKQFSYEKPGDARVLMIDTLGAVKVGRFKDDQKLDATYEGGATARSGIGSGLQTFVAASGTFDFHPDGTFGKETVASFNTNGKDAGVSGGSTTAGGGRYKLSGNTLTLSSADGKQSTSYTVYPYPDKDEFPPMHLFCNGTMYQRERPKP